MSGSVPSGPDPKDALDGALEAWRREHDLWQKRAERADGSAATLLTLSVTIIGILIVTVVREFRDDPDGSTVIVLLLAALAVAVAGSTAFAVRLVGRWQFGVRTRRYIGRRLETAHAGDRGDALASEDDEFWRHHPDPGALNRVFLLERKLDEWVTMDWRAWVAQEEERRALLRRTSALSKEATLTFALALFAVGAVAAAAALGAALS